MKRLSPPAVMPSTESPRDINDQKNVRTLLITYMTASNCRVTEMISQNKTFPRNKMRQIAYTIRLYVNQIMKVTTMVWTIGEDAFCGVNKELIVVPIKTLITMNPNSFGLSFGPR